MKLYLGLLLRTIVYDLFLTCMPPWASFFLMFVLHSHKCQGLLLTIIFWFMSKSALLSSCYILPSAAIHISFISNSMCVFSPGYSLCLGKSYFFRFNHPEEASRMKSMLPQKSPVSALAYNTGTHKGVGVGAGNPWKCFNLMWCFQHLNSDYILAMVCLKRLEILTALPSE